MIPQIRLAVPADLETINDIYNHYVRTCTCTFQEDDGTIEERIAWYAGHGGEHPVTVAELDGKVVGWGSLSRFKTRSAYRFTVEDSLYVHKDVQGRGVGSAILGDLILRASEAGHRSIIAIISADQPASIALHTRFRFTQCAHLKQAGIKFGRWLDVVYMQLMLRNATAK